jgi:hypothetical protein
MIFFLFAYSSFKHLKTTPKGYIKQILSNSAPSEPQSDQNYPKCKNFLSSWLKKGVLSLPICRKKVDPPHPLYPLYWPYPSYPPTHPESHFDHNYFFPPIFSFLQIIYKGLPNSTKYE